jgi:hypothetical protein
MKIKKNMMKDIMRKKDKNKNHNIVKILHINYHFHLLKIMLRIITYLNSI